ncbi:hypothetical protein HAZT_HAZT007920 [Hyalella azteca]|uniref:Ig-like domain-containing protein n=1 Tax=Hyalella azteca TaxID=294128 RepID=A0A6A0HAK4_HYAAZ|nr:hypothetical protein HAZT_HAZT007920 [Hyalella azteca]
MKSYNVIELNNAHEAKVVISGLWPQPFFPPEILDSSSSTSSVVVQENGNATLSCHATGNPPPHISWVREDQKHITIDKRKKGTKAF